MVEKSVCMTVYILVPGTSDIGVVVVVVLVVVVDAGISPDLVSERARGK